MRTREDKADPNSEKYSDRDSTSLKKNRRPRRSSGERNYVCGCSKVSLG